MGRRWLLLLGLALAGLLGLFAFPRVRYAVLPWAVARLLDVTLYTFPPWGFVVTRVTPGEPMTVPVGGRELPADYFPPRGSLRGRLLLVHGSLPRGRAFPLYRLLARAWADRGYAVLVPDLPGYGEVTLRPGEVPDFAGAVAAAAAVLARLTPGEPREGPILLGHSIGAAAVLAATVAERVRPRALLLWDPPLDLHRRLEHGPGGLVRRFRGELRTASSPPPDDALLAVLTRLETVALLQRLQHPQPPVLVILGGVVGPQDRRRLVTTLGLEVEWLTLLDLVDLDHFLDAVPWPRSSTVLFYRPASLRLFVASVGKWLEGPWGRGRSIRTR